MKRKTITYLKKYKTESILAPIFKMLEAVFELIVPIVVAKIIDEGILKSDKTFIINHVVLMIVLAVIGMIVSITAQYFAAKAASYFGRDLRQGLFDKIQSLSFSEIDEIGTSTLITRLSTDTNQIQNGINLTLRLLLRSPFIVFGTVIAAFTIDVKCAFVFLSTVIILSVIIFLIMRFTLPRYKSIQNELDGVTMCTDENLRGARVIRAFSCENDEINQFKEKTNRLASFQKAVGKISSLLNPLTYLIINLAIILIIQLGGNQVNDGVVSQGEVVALYNYLSQILVELLKLANLIITITRSFASMSRIDEILNLDNDLKSSNDDEIKTGNSVDFENVSFRYNNAKEDSLSDISFSVKKGNVIGVVGSTGSGKSSLISLIAHFYDASSGTVRVDGINVDAYDKNTLRDKIGFVMQKSVMFKGTIRDNLKWGNKNATDDEMFEALRIAQIYDTVLEKGGLDAEVQQNGSNFSGGQLQRLSIARALVRKPEILILDDSTSALDYQTESNLREEIFNLEYNPTIFIISQRASSVLDADDILVLEDGHIVGEGTHSALLSNCEIYKEIYYSQFEKEEVR